MKGYIYLLKDVNGNRYIGSTNDLNRRILEHKRKHKNSRYTKSGHNWELVYFEEFESIELARRFEREIKKKKNLRQEFYKRAEIPSERSSVG